MLRIKYTLPTTVITTKISKIWAQSTHASKTLTMRDYEPIMNILAGYSNRPTRRWLLLSQSQL